jgi:putative ABC transport system ATP-binding protein
VLALTDVSRTYGTVDAVSGVSLEVVPGELLVISGPSGSGKTTLLQLLGALDRPTGGTVAFDGRDVRDMGEGELARLRRDSLGFVFQQFNLIPTLSAQQNVEAALVPHARAIELLERVGLGDRLGHLPSQLSGGEQQRVAIARALANRPQVLLADEPTGNLDSATGKEIVALLRTLVEEGIAVVLVTHDPGVAAAGDRVLVMRDGRMTESLHRDYLVVVAPEAGGGFRASVPDVPGCEASGATAEEAVANARDALLARDGALPPPSASARTLSV